MRIGLAFRVWWRILTDRRIAERVRDLLAGPERDAPARAEPAAPARPAPAPSPPARSDALLLLATLQREARFVDLVREPLDSYGDAQVGAAAREVLRDCGQVLDRLFELQPVLEAEEGSAVEVPRGFDAGCYRLSGQVEGEPPYTGRLVHHGWQAACCKMPQWSGSQAARLVVAPAEVEISAAPGTGGEDRQ